MVPAASNAGLPATGRRTAGKAACRIRPRGVPALIQIGTEGGFLPAPVLLPNQPVSWNLDPTMFNVGNVLQQNEGGGTLILGPAERADVIVDFSQFAGQTLILYNDAPTAFPALDPHYDYYTGAPDRTDIGGVPSHPAGRRPQHPDGHADQGDGSSAASRPSNDYNPATLSDAADSVRLNPAFAGRLRAGARSRSSWGRPPTIPPTTRRSPRPGRTGASRGSRTTPSASSRSTGRS